MSPRAAPARPITILHAFSTFELGGPQSRFLRLFDAFGDGYRHVVAAMDNCFDAAARIEGDPKLTLLRLPVRKGRGLANVPMLSEQIGQVAPDVLVSYNWGASEWMLANARRRVPQLHVEEGFGPEETAQRLWRRSVVRALAVRASGATLVTVSETLAAIARREWRVPRAKLVTVPNGVDIARYRPAPGAARPAFARGNELVVGTVAGLRREKRVDRLIDAVALARRRGADLRLVIAGDGTERPALERRIAEAGLAGHCDLLGFVADPAPLYAGFDFFGLSSDTEQMPIALLEAMAAGLPAVATDVGDVRSILRSNLDEQVVARDAEAMAEALARLAGDRSARQRIGAANAERAAAHYTEQRMIATWRGLIDSAAARGAARLRPAAVAT